MQTVTANTTPLGPIRARLRDPPSARPASPAALTQSYIIGEEVKVPSMGLTGTLKFIGPTHFKPGVWAGVHLHQTGQGKNNGTVQGKAYFSCPPNSGIFVLAQKLEPMAGANGRSGPSTPTSGRAASGPGTGPRGALQTSPAPSRLGARATRFVNMSANLRQRDRAGNEFTTPSKPKSQMRSGQTGTAGSSSATLGRAPARRMTITPLANKGRRPSPGPRSTDPQATGLRARSPTTQAKPPLGKSRPNGRLGGRPNLDPDTEGSVASGLMTPLNQRRAALSALSTSRLNGDSKLSSRLRESLAQKRTLLNKENAHQDTPNLAVAGADPKMDSPRPHHESPAGVSTETHERIKLKLEMMEAENKVLRLENEQGRAQLKARQLIERDLVRQQILQEQQQTPTRDSDTKSVTGLDGSMTYPSALRPGYEEWKDEVGDMDAKIRSMGDYIAQLSQKLASLQSPARQAPPTVTPTSKAADRAQRPMSELMEDNLYDEVLKLTEAVQAKDTCINALETQLDHARQSAKVEVPLESDEVDHLRQKVVSLDSQLANWSTRYHTLEQDHQQAVDAAAQRIASLMEQVRLLEAQLATEQAEAQKSVAVIEDLKNALADNEAVVVRQKEEVTLLITQMDSLVGKALDASQVIRAMGWSAEKPQSPSGATTPRADSATDATKDPSQRLNLHRENGQQVLRVLDHTTHAVEQLQKMNNRLSADLNAFLQERGDRLLSPSESTAVSVANTSFASNAAGSGTAEHARPAMAVAEWQNRYQHLLSQHESLQSLCAELRAEVQSKEEQLVTAIRATQTVSPTTDNALSQRSSMFTPSHLPNGAQVDAMELDFNRALPSATKLNPELNDSIRELHQMLSEVDGGDQPDVSNEILSQEVSRLRQSLTGLQQQLDANLATRDHLQQDLKTVHAERDALAQKLDQVEQEQLVLETRLQEAQETVVSQAARIEDLTVSDAAAKPETDADMTKVRDEADGLQKILEAKDDQIQGLKEAIQGLETRNADLEQERDKLLEDSARYMEEQEILHEHLNIVETECNKLLDDIEMLSTENARLNEELATVSGKSSLSVDVRSLIGGGPVTNTAGADTSASKEGEPAQIQQLSAAVQDALATTADKQRSLERLQEEHRLELRKKEKQLRELETAKETEIEALNKDLSELEALIESKIFREADLEDQHDEDCKRIKRLEAELAQLQDNGHAAGIDSLDSSRALPSATRAGRANTNATSPHSADPAVSATSSPGGDKALHRHSMPAGTVDDSDSESKVCELCDEDGHDLFHCPLFKSNAPGASKAADHGDSQGTKYNDGEETNSLYGYGGDDSDGGSEPQIFKNQPDVGDDSRLFCANCEVFDQHWTEDCPNQDETF
ncbi:hypothetical protein H4R34_003769 [Dimargaris verticillata]|uniref:CAP-Gly domain-containing protein n=1 Tax=Dimargaris verticillata TaxID=2761393 RepID=A0A9W8B3W6_9FUNG|nr:hypothetical protein H4R34_003769 [Dimargaris verticillata]